jgi:hypothetical protein
VPENQLLKKENRLKFYHKKKGYPVAAVQFTGPESIEKIRQEMCCEVTTGPDFIIADGTKIMRGEYAVPAMCAIVAMDQKTFNERFGRDEVQLKMFDN